MSHHASTLALLRNLQLASPSLPIGAYAYSQGLEWAVEAGWVKDEGGLAIWLEEQLEHSIGRVDLPLLARLYGSAETRDEPETERWTNHLLAMRETAELRADDCDRGRALARLLRDLAIDRAEPWSRRDDVPLATLFAIAAVEWSIPLSNALLTYAWGWLENQVLAGVKLIPLGQVAGQRLLLDLTFRIEPVCETALSLRDEDIGGTLPSVALASCLHETQYTRLFRSWNGSRWKNDDCEGDA